MNMIKSIIIITGGQGFFPRALVASQEDGTNNALGNGGIGFETAAQLMAKSSNHVIVGSRSAQKGQAAVKDLESRGLPGSVEMLQLEVTSHDSVTSAARTVEAKHGK